MFTIDLNSDLGESFGSYIIGMDDAVIKHISSANIACGFHASDPLVMDKTVKMAIDNNVAIGAHPGFPDLMGFGRRNMAVTPKEARAYVTYQVGALKGFTDSYGVKLQHVKAHGALYNMCVKDYNLARAVCEAVYDVDPSLIVLGLASSQWIRAGKDACVNIRSEIFADRAYMSDGSLVPRSQDGAVIHDKDFAIKRAITMIKEHKVTSISGDEIEIVPQSLCVHGDNPMAVEFVKEIRIAFENAGITVKKMSD